MMDPASNKIVTTHKHQNWFRYRQGMKYHDIPPSAERVLVEHGVTGIEKNAFRNHENLRHIQISSTVIIIGPQAFYGCKCLVTVEFEKDSKLEQIRTMAFRECHSLKAIALPATVCAIHQYSFRDCQEMALVVIQGDSTSNPSRLEFIGDDCFSGCTAIKGKIDLSHCSALRSIPPAAFYKNGSLKSILLPQNLEFIGAYAFHECTSMEEVIFTQTASASRTTAVDQIGLGIPPPFQGCISLHKFRFSNEENEEGRQQQQISAAFSLLNDVEFHLNLQSRLLGDFRPITDEQRLGCIYFVLQSMMETRMNDFLALLSNA